jgi:hypothetical protein
MHEMSSAILLSLVLILMEFIPSREPIMREQKKRVIRRPILDFLHAPVVQLKAEALLVTLRRTGQGSLEADIVLTTWSNAQ